MPNPAMAKNLTNNGTVLRISLYSPYPDTLHRQWVI